MALLYHNHEDVVAVRSEILTYGVSDFTTQMEEAEAIVNRALDSKWYRSNAENFGLDWRETPFDTALMLEVSIEQVKRSCVYKSLQLIYLLLAKESPEPDGFERNSSTFKKLYAEEITEVLTAGIDYDWDQDDEISDSESKIPEIRRLYRV